MREINYLWNYLQPRRLRKSWSNKTRSFAPNNNWESWKSDLQRRLQFEDTSTPRHYSPWFLNEWC